MTSQHMRLDFAAHVPHSADAVSPACHQQIQSGVQRHGVDPAQVAMILANDLQCVTEALTKDRKSPTIN